MHLNGWWKTHTHWDRETRRIFSFDMMWILNCESIDWQHFSWKVVLGHLRDDAFYLEFFCCRYRSALYPFQWDRFGAVRCVGWFASNTIGFGNFENAIRISVHKTHHGNQVPRCKLTALHCCSVLIVRLRSNWWLFFGWVRACIPGNWQRQRIRNRTWNQAFKPFGWRMSTRSDPSEWRNQRTNGHNWN